ncbi:MAG: hypothetical protein H7A43_02580 [Verrucomicrobia bacterium]|nr:hypothetical protein [Verrucomicrobiota bacterium]
MRKNVSTLIVIAAIVATYGFYYCATAQWFFTTLVPATWNFVWEPRDGIRGNPIGGGLMPALACLTVIAIWTALPFFIGAQIFERMATPKTKEAPISVAAKLLYLTAFSIGGVLGGWLGLLCRL